MNNIHHLYWRAGFGLSPVEWREKKHWNVQKAVDELFAGAATATTIAHPDSGEIPLRPGQMSREERAELRKKERRLVVLQNVDWLERMAAPGHSALLERMSLFWHGHFACTTMGSKPAAAQLNTIRKHALGTFRNLLLSISRDVSMIRFLNNQQNRKQKPNENFARELMELFTIGRGNYTEQDVKEAARAFTGWSSNLRAEYVFRANQHDYGVKTFFGKTGRFNGEDVIDILLEKRETAEFICRNIYRYFVNAKVNEEIVQQLAGLFYNSGYNIALLMRSIFESNWFYSAENAGSKIKSPVELIAGMMRSLNVSFENRLALVFVQKALGQILFNPPNVAGWPGAKAWIDNSTLMLRLNLATYLFDSSNVNFRLKDDPKAMQRGKAQKKLTARIDLQPLIKLVENKTEAEIFEGLSAYLLQTQPNVGKQLLDDFSPGSGREDYIKLLVMRLMSLPEYQMC